MLQGRVIASLRAVSLHLIVSAIVAALVASILFIAWFPFPYWHLSGGLHLFGILIAIDVVCGPLLTGVVFNPDKSFREKVLDLSLVVLIQLSALAYGIYSISQARPVVVAFEVDRMVVVSASQVDSDKLPLAPEALRSLSWHGPIAVGTRTSTNGEEMIRSLDASMQGVPPSARPDWWTPYQQSQAAIKMAMKPLSTLRDQFDAAQKAVIDEFALKTTLPISQIYYLPLVSQKSLDRWIVLFDDSARIIEFVPVSGFES